MTLRKQGVPGKLIQTAASIIVILGFLSGTIVWGMATQAKADEALRRTEQVEEMFTMMCLLSFHALGPQTKRVPEGCEKYRPLTRE